jgi:3',5'-cyclic AMP phosphodiesterase CpdA
MISGNQLFSFAILTDTHMNQAEDYSSSPYPCNALANARTRRVIAELNRGRPDFVVHLGDVVNPVPELPSYEEAAHHFKTLVGDLQAPLYIVPGNHDIGDKPVSWMPAGTVNSEHIALYEKHFGRHFSSFDHRDLHVVLVNSPMINSGLAEEEEQRRWLDADLAASAGKRTFLCTHYPPYVSQPQENGSYDNIDEPGRSWLLELIRKYKPEATFCGHAHNFWYDIVGQTEVYLLPSTTFVRHDYSELYRIEPGPERGRDDGAKLGYFWVHVYESGHVAENVRTYGRTLDVGAALPHRGPRVRALHSKESRITSVGIDLRQPWAEELEIAPSGAVDEFERKKARNDAPIQALWEMGIRRLRVPLQDLLDPRIRRRMEIMRRSGHVFHVYCYNVPQGAARNTVVAHRDLIDVLELVINWEHAAAAVAEIAELHRASGCCVFLSRVNRKDSSKHDGARFNHLISHGFSLSECGELGDFVAAETHAAAIDGVMFRVPRDVPPAAAAVEGREAARALGKTACLYVKTSSASPAEAFDDEAANAARFAEAVFAGAACAGVDVILDTFADVDRGYFCRVGLVDRRFNPKLGSRIVRNLFALMNGAAWRLSGAGWGTEDGARFCCAENRSRERLVLVLPGAKGMDLTTLAAGKAFAGAELVDWVDLDSGRIHECTAGAQSTTRPVVLRLKVDEG